MILVTGGTGLIGSHLLYQLLHTEERIRVLKRKGSKTEDVKNIFSYYSKNANALFAKIEWIDGDIMDIPSLMNAMNDVSQVYHCAAIVSLGGKNAKDMVQNNVDGTANVVNVAIQKKIQKLCHVSSVAALGIDDKKEITEQSSWNDKSNFSMYAIGKYLSENEVWRGIQEGLNAIIVNPSYVIGPGNWHRSKKDIFLTATNGLRWYTAGSSGFVDVRNVADCMIQLVNSSISNERFILSSENLSYKKFLELIHISLNRPLPTNKAGKHLLKVVRTIDGLKNLFMNSPAVITKEIATYSTIQLHYNNKKIKTVLNYSFIPIEQSIKETSLHFLNENNSSEK